MSEPLSKTIYPPCGGAIKETVTVRDILFVVTDYCVYELIEYADDLVFVAVPFIEGKPA